MPIYSGEFRHALDPKNRVTIPSRWRRSEADEFYLMPDRTNRFLRAMPPAEFAAAVDRVTNNPQVSMSDRAVFLRHFYSSSQHMVVDKQGRLLIPEEHRARLDLRGEIVLSGARDTIEIWNAQTWDQAKTAEADTFNRVAELAGL